MSVAEASNFHRASLTGATTARGPRKLQARENEQKRCLSGSRGRLAQQNSRAAGFGHQAPVGLWCATPRGRWRGSTQPSQRLCGPRRYPVYLFTSPLAMLVIDVCCRIDFRTAELCTSL